MLKHLNLCESFHHGALRGLSAVSGHSLKATKKRVWPLLQERPTFLTAVAWVVSRLKESESTDQLKELVNRVLSCRNFVESINESVTPLSNRLLEIFYSYEDQKKYDDMSVVLGEAKQVCDGGEDSVVIDTIRLLREMYLTGLISRVTNSGEESLRSIDDIRPQHLVSICR